MSEMELIKNVARGQILCLKKYGQRNNAKYYNYMKILAHGEQFLKRVLFIFLKK